MFESFMRPKEQSFEEGNAAKRIEPEIIESEPASFEAAKQEMVELRKKQYSEKGYTEEDRKRFQQLYEFIAEQEAFTEKDNERLEELFVRQNDEENPWSDSEMEEYLRLTRKKERAEKELH